MAPDSPVMIAAREICSTWELTPTEVDKLLTDDDTAATVIRIYQLLHQLYSGALPDLWLTIPNANVALGGSPDRPVRPVDHALNCPPSGLADVLRLLEGYAA